MKISNIFLAFATLSLSQCSWFNKKPQVKAPLEIPNVDVENLSINFPEKPVYNTGSIKTSIESEVTYDYLDFYEISDFHGAVNYEVSSTGTAKLGLAKLATYLNNKRALNEGGTFVLSTGDMFQGSAESNLTRGYLVNYSMQYMGFDAMAVGNHEFDWTDEWLKKNSELSYNTSTIPYLGINIIDKQTNEIPTFLKKSVTIERGGYKVGIIGSIGPTLTSSILASCIANYDFVDETELVEAEASRLKGDGCDFVILLAHEGVDQLHSYSGVDAIFGGHAHIKQSTNVTVPIAATSNYGQSVAHISFKINRNTKQYTVETCTVEEMLASEVSSLADNLGVKNIYDQYAVEVNKIKNIKLGTANDDLLINGALKNICTTSMFDAAKKSVTEEGIKNLDGTNIDSTKIVASFHNVNGGIRTDILKGTITYGSVYSPFPFDNEIVLLKFKGSFLKNKYNGMANLGTYKIFDDKNYFDVNEYYYIVATDYIALSTSFLNNQVSFTSIDDSKLIHTGKVVRDVVAKFIYEKDSISSDDFMNKKEYNPISM